MHQHDAPIKQLVATKLLEVGDAACGDGVCVEKINSAEIGRLGILCAGQEDREFDGLAGLKVACAFEAEGPVAAGCSSIAGDHGLGFDGKAVCAGVVAWCHKHVERYTDRQGRERFRFRDDGLRNGLVEGRH